MKGKIVELIKLPLRKLLSLIRVIVYSDLNSFLYRIFNIKNCYLCPICKYYGRFKTTKPKTGKRINARCPRCGSLERHRMQYLVFKEVAKNVDITKMSMLHFSPEDYFRNIFKSMFKTYVTSDLDSTNVDRREDLTRLSIDDSSFDFIYASHILEHIKDDVSALSEIKRVLKPGGIAIIPVPILGSFTIEYDKPNPSEYYHVRCPGQDYYDKYKKYFPNVQLYKSSDFDEKYQVHIYENRNNWSDALVHRPSVPGEKHIDIVPVCFK